MAPKRATSKAAASIDDAAKAALLAEKKGKALTDTTPQESFEDDAVNIKRHESLLEGVDRRNLKIINLSTHYKPGLVLERILSPREKGKQINQEIMLMIMVSCFTEVRF
jgi:hypothetical protein